MDKSGCQDPLYVVDAGQTITAWAVSPLIEHDFPGEPAPAEDRVDYRFINGFVDVGDLPCRKAFRATMIGRPVAPPDEWVQSHLNLPGANRRVEFTHFWHVPTHVQRWLRGTFRSPARRDLALRLRTCGGARIWVNGEEQVRFEPFLRNQETTKDVSLRLQAGDNAILVLTEDLAERDTIWFVEFEVVDPEPITVHLPIAQDGPTIARLEALVRGVRPARDVFVRQPLELLFDSSPEDDVPIAVEVYSHGHNKAILSRSTAVLQAGCRSLVVPQTAELRDGYHGLRLRIGEGGSTVTRTLDAAFLAQVRPAVAQPELASRKAEALTFSARHGAPRIGRVLAMAASDEIDPEALERLVDATLQSINRREDCSDFVLVPLLWLLIDYPDSLPTSLLDRVRTAVLGYRYWVDEPGNDTMWFWSENHVLCFHVSQLLAGRALPDAVFVASGRSGEAQAALAQERLGRWFDSVEAHGLAEWNSAAYYPVDFIGLLALEHLAGPDLAARARRQLDLIFTMIALHTLDGVPAGSQGRAYDKELRAGPMTELAPFARVAFGKGWLNDGVASLPMFCAGRYRPPAGLESLAELDPGRAIEARYAQGLESGKLVLYKTDAAQLSTVVDHKTGRKGHQQHVLDIRLAGHPMARLWINHPGEDDPWGTQRPSYWAGNGILPRVAQHCDTAMMVVDASSARLSFSHAYLGRDGFDDLLIEDRWLFARTGRGFAALGNSHGLGLVTDGATAGREVRAPGPLSGWVAVVGSGDEGAFRRFRDRLRSSVIGFEDESRSLSFQPPGDAPRVSLAHAGDFRIGDVPQPFVHLQPAPVLTYDSVNPTKGEGQGPLFR